MGSWVSSKGLHSYEIQTGKNVLGQNTYEISGSERFFTFGIRVFWH